MIKNIYLLSFFITAVFNSFAQEKQYQIDGKIIGNEVFKYVYAFDNEYQLINKINIIDNKFKLKGIYNEKQRFGEVPYLKILLSNVEEKDLDKKWLSYNKYFNCKVILAEFVHVTYYSQKKVFKLEGGPMNKVQNEFEENYSIYRNQLDSAYAELKTFNLSNQDLSIQKSKAYHRLLTKMAYKFIDIIKANADSEASLFNFGIVLYNQGITAGEVVKVFNEFSSRLKSSEYGKHIFKDVETRLKQEEQLAKPSYVVGMQMPQFTLANEQNVNIAMQSKFAKYTLIDFWATWCAPCRQETPNLIKVWNKFQSKGFNVITVSIDEEKDKQKWLGALDKDNMSNFINLFNGNDASGIVRELKIVAIPSNYLVNQTGKIVSVNLRGDALEKKMAELFK